MRNHTRNAFFREMKRTEFPTKFKYLALIRRGRFLMDKQGRKVITNKPLSDEFLEVRRLSVREVELSDDEINQCHVLGLGIDQP